MPDDTVSTSPAGSEFSGGRIQIVGTENAKIISVNAISIPLHLKVEGDSRTYTMEMAIKIDSLISEE
jgi:hypothetical protein